MAGAAPKRQRDFALGRACAHAALAKLGHGDAVIGRADKAHRSGPIGMVGSITHTKGYAAALVASAAAFPGIGVDAERVGGRDPRTCGRACLMPPSWIHLLRLD